MLYDSFADISATPAYTYDPYHVVESFQLARQLSLPEFITPRSTRQLISLTEPDRMTIVHKKDGSPAIEYFSAPLKTIVRAEPQPSSNTWRLSSWTVSGSDDDETIQLALSICRMDDAPPMLQRDIVCASTAYPSSSLASMDYRDGHAVSSTIISFAQESQLTAAVTSFAR